MSVYQLGPSSDTAVTLYPEFDYGPDRKQIRSDHRSKSGKLYMYKWGDYDIFDAKVNWVPASDAALVNSWWDTNTELLWFVTSGGATEANSVMITNVSRPLAGYNKPYDNYFKGKIELEGY